ncbi:Very-short-patch-repair endonuclease [Salegentibacter holothuriorum]|uniref:Very-short-patch-repair endonuclease n=1 Tax=Salegentibacter holothuriorum TaxID=241145 RepID=A0A1T5DFP7_9FLAO|nr:endonuclease domain-containing protein [Salegentibacter holothuriorum]SKB70568.1 Very-short-patch-repair endonuclease [Salegentibacter holothuriorum]
MESKNNLYHDDSMFKGATPSIFQKARHLRKNTTPAEKKLWNELRNKKLNGYKFRKQHPIHLFIVDFYCHELGLIIEVDGKYHDKTEQIKKDQERTELLKFQNLKLIRFTNDEVINKLHNVLEEIKRLINNP